MRASPVIFNPFPAVTLVTRPLSLHNLCNKLCSEQHLMKLNAEKAIARDRFFELFACK